MPDSSPVILERFESGLLASVPRPRPDTVFVLSYNGGELRTYVRTPTMIERRGSKYCFVVDASERHSHGKLRIPSMGDIYFFAVEYNAVWYVTDPAAVVRRNVTDADGLVRGFLRDSLWRVGRSYGPSEVQAAEDEITRNLRPPFDLGNGLTLTGLSVRLVLDKRQALATQEVHADAHRGQLEQNRIMRLRQLVDGDESFLLLHLAQHPDDTKSVLQMLADTRERNDQIRLGLLDRMLDRGFIQDADIAGLRNSVLGGHSAPALPSGPATTSSHQTAAPQPTASGTWGYTDAAAGPAMINPVTPVTGPDTAPEPEDQPPGATPPAVPPPAAPGNVTNWKPVGSRRHQGGHH